MTQEIINVGTTPNSEDADTIRVAFTKTKNNFSELYSSIGADDIKTTAAFDHANAGFDFSNTKAPAFGIANLAYNLANTIRPGFSVANAAFDFANTKAPAFDVANLAYGIANVAFGNANTTHTYALGVNQNVVSAFAFANSVNVFAYGVRQNTVSAYGHANLGFNTSNASFNVTNTVFSISNNTWAFANAINDFANTINVTATGAYNTVNSVSVAANSYAGSMANAANAYAASTYSLNTHGHPTIYYTANIAFDTANAAYNYANAIGSTSNFNTINVAYDTANAAYNKANTVSSDLTNTTSILTSRITNDAPFRNRLINGNMKINQQWGEGNQVIFTLARQGRGCDGWAYDYVPTPWTHHDFTTPNTGGPEAFTHYISMRVMSNSYFYYANSTAALCQPVEGHNITDFNWGTANASNVTLSFWVNTTNTGTFGGSISNGLKNRSYTFSYTVNQPDTWEYKTVNIPGPTDGVWYSNNNTGLVLRFDQGSANAVARTMTSNTWLTGNYWRPNNTISMLPITGTYFRLTGVQLEKGDYNTAFEIRPMSVELSLCQRYCEKSWDLTTGAWSMAGYGFANNANGSAIFTAKNTTDFYNGGQITFKTKKRTSPEMIGYSTYDGGVWSFQDTTTGTNAGTVSFIYSDESSSRANSSSAGLTATRDYRYHWIAQAQLPL